MLTHLPNFGKILKPKPGNKKLSLRLYRRLMTGLGPGHTVMGDKYMVLSTRE